MGKPGTINVVGEDKALETSRAIIKTHLYTLQNVAVLTDRERGYMFNEYFPKVKKYLEPPIGPIITFVGDGYLGEPWESDKNKAKRSVLTDQFKWTRDAGQPDYVSLSVKPKVIVSVRVAKSPETEKMGATWCLEPVKGWTVNTTTGVIDFMEKVNTVEIMNYLKVNCNYYIFVDYVAATEYEVGTDGEN